MITKIQYLNGNLVALHLYSEGNPAAIKAELDRLYNVGTLRIPIDEFDETCTVVFVDRERWKRGLMLSRWLVKPDSFFKQLKGRKWKKREDFLLVVKDEVEKEIEALPLEKFRPQQHLKATIFSLGHVEPDLAIENSFAHAIGDIRPAL